MVITGKTIDGKETVGGIFSIYETYGISLDIILSYCMNNNLAIDWCNFIKDAIEANVKRNTISSKIKETFEMVEIRLSKEHLDWLNRLSGE